MITWILNNISSIIVCVVLLAVVSAIVVHMTKNRKHGKSSCGCGCQSCAMKDSCHGGK